MTWREMVSYGGPEARRIHDAAFPKSPLEPGRNIRIMMEEEVKDCCCFTNGAVFLGKPIRYCPECGKAVTRNVSECCEKWRGRFAWPSCDVKVWGNTAVCTTSRPAVFCPECGKKL